MYDIASDAWIGWAPETGAITDAADNSTATLPALPNFTIVGYNKLPAGKRGLNNTKAFTAALAGAAYTKKGNVAPEISFEFCAGALGLLAYCVRASEDAALPYVCIYEGVYGGWTNVYRFAKCSTLAIAIQLAAQSNEITINAAFWAIARTALTTPPLATRSLLRALGTPLMAHDLRQFQITNSAGVTADYRKGATNVSYNVDNKLERINQRNNWGEDHALSRTCYEIREHTIVAGGEMGFNRKLSETLFTGAKNAQDWGDIKAIISDGPALPAGGTPKAMTLTATGCTPGDESGQGGDADTTLNWTVPFSANNLLLELPQPEA
ncbi:MAG TPA: hypothetical protein VGB45_08380 [Abditibacterium sp.]|jgi:hypothetical protein